MTTAEVNKLKRRLTVSGKLDAYLEKMRLKKLEGAGGTRWKTHFTEPEGFSKTGGVKGAHTEDAFKKYFSDEGLQYQEISSVNHPKIDGIREIEYKVQAKDYTGKPIEGQFKAAQYPPKTLVDTSKISIETIEKWAGEAQLNGVKGFASGGKQYFKGTAENGLKFEGWIDTASGQFDSLYPVLEWTHP